MTTSTRLVRRYFVDLARTCGALCRPVPVPGQSRRGRLAVPRSVRPLG